MYVLNCTRYITTAVHMYKLQIHIYWGCTIKEAWRPLSQATHIFKCNVAKQCFTVPKHNSEVD